MDLWQQLLGEVEAPGPFVQWLHVPSHIGVHGNDTADLLADMGCRRTRLLRKYVTASRAILDNPDKRPQSDPESDLEACPLWTGAEELETKVHPCHSGRRHYGNPPCAHRRWRIMGHLSPQKGHPCQSCRLHFWALPVMPCTGKRESK